MWPHGPIIDESLAPFIWYRDLAASGAASFGLPPTYVDAIRAIPANPDPDPTREAEERAFMPCEGADMRAYLRAEFRALALLGALARSRTYRVDAPGPSRASFREALGDCLESAAQRYSGPVRDAEHTQVIVSMCRELSGRFSDVLRDGRLRIGVAQKALNLYLKYLWCAGWIAEPPHCPFDSILIALLPPKNRVAWTKLDDEKDYRRLVAAARRVAGGRTLAQWELMEYERARSGDA